MVRLSRPQEFAQCRASPLSPRQLLRSRATTRTRIFRMQRRDVDGLPRRNTFCRRVVIDVAVANGGDRTPEGIVDLASNTAMSASVAAIATSDMNRAGSSTDISWRSQSDGRAVDGITELRSARSVRSQSVVACVWCCSSRRSPSSHCSPSPILRWSKRREAEVERSGYAIANGVILMKSHPAVTMVSV